MESVATACASVATRALRPLRMTRAGGNATWRIRSSRPSLRETFCSCNPVTKPALLRHLFALAASYPARMLSYTKMPGRSRDVYRAESAQIIWMASTSPPLVWAERRQSEGPHDGLHAAMTGRRRGFARAARSAVPPRSQIPTGANVLYVSLTPGEGSAPLHDEPHGLRQERLDRFGLANPPENRPDLIEPGRRDRRGACRHSRWPRLDCESRR
jgi:hypothetical protein